VALYRQASELPKKQAAAEKLSSTETRHDNQLPKNCAASFDEIVSNTVSLFVVWQKKRNG
jgi:hypothetical protein